MLANQTCVYCATKLIDRRFTKEHVIGRHFVPKGALNGEWNLIVRACSACNNAKSDLEDDISAITLQPDAWGQHPIDHPIRDLEARRKAKGSNSRRTNKAVSQSEEHIDFELPFGPGVKASVSFVSPPQLDEDRVYQLCFLHSRAFFYWITYDETSRRGHIWPGGFFPVRYSMRSDWGNPIHKAFMDTVFAWELRVQGSGAREHFRVAIRKHPSAHCWSWAYEWNANARIVGFFGEQAAAQGIVDTLPLPKKTIFRDGRKIIRYWEEKPLLPDEDTLFS